MINNLFMRRGVDPVTCVYKRLKWPFSSMSYLRSLRHYGEVNLWSVNLCTANTITINSQIYDWFNVDINGVQELFIGNINFDYRRFLFFAVLRLLFMPWHEVYKFLSGCNIIPEEENAICGCVCLFYVLTPERICRWMQF